MTKDTDSLDSEFRKEIWAYLSILYQREGSLSAALVGLASALVGVIVVALTGATGNTKLPIQFRLGAVFAPPLIFGVFLYIYTQSRTLGAYIRRLERALREDHHRPSLVPVRKIGSIPVPFWSALDSALYARHRSARFPLVFRFGFGVLAFSMWAFVYASSIALALTLEEKYKYTTLAVTTVLLLVEFLWYARASDKGHFEKVAPAAAVVEHERAGGTDHRASTLEMVRLMFVPRIASLSKGAWIIWGGLAGFGVSQGILQPGGRNLADLLIGLLIVEFVLNQGRYLVNNMRDRQVDLASTDLQVSSRLGDLNLTQSLILALSVAARLVGAFLLADQATDQAISELQLVVLGIVLLTIAYEAARERPAREQITEKWGRRVRCEAVYLLAALGYALRVGLGFRLIAGNSMPMIWFVGLLVGVTACHYSMVLMGWVLAGMEGLPPQNKKESNADRVPAKHFLGSINAKPHFKRLMEEVNLLDKEAQPLRPKALACLLSRDDRYEHWCDHPVAYAAVAESKGFRWRIRNPALIGISIAIVSLASGSELVALNHVSMEQLFKLLGFISIVLLASPWKWFEVSKIARDLQAKERKPPSAKKSRKAAWPTLMLFLFMGLLASIGVASDFGPGWPSEVIRSVGNYVRSDHLLAIALRQLALGAAAASIVFFLIKDPFGTALSSLASLRRTPHIIRITAYKIIHKLLNGLTTIFFGKGSRSIFGRDLWRTEMAYKTDDVVYFDGSLFIARDPTSSSIPRPDSPEWQELKRIASHDVYQHAVSWSPSKEYDQGDVVFSDGSIFVAKCKHMNLAPSPISNDWHLLTNISGLTLLEMAIQMSRGECKPVEVCLNELTKPTGRSVFEPSGSS